VRRSWSGPRQWVNSSTKSNRFNGILRDGCDFYIHTKWQSDKILQHRNRTIEPLPM
ncbi:predicted protein, partial [Arabidopsis lyrata subsp. lyrata]